MPKEFSVKGPIFKLALEHGSDFQRFAPGAKAGKPVKAKTVQSLVDKGVYAWFAYMPLNRWTGRETERWRVGVDERSGDYVEFQALRDVDFSNIKDLAAAEAAKASGGKRKPPRALVKELIEAVKKGDEAEVARLAPLAGAGEFEDRRPIDIAAEYGKPRLVELLLPHCDPNFVREDGAVEPQALFQAVRGGSTEAVELLLPRCDPKGASSEGWTALMSATRARNGWELVDLLLPRSDVDAAERRDGHTALMMAALAGNRDVVRTLLPHADLNKQDAKGRSALMLALDPQQHTSHMDWHETSRRADIARELLAAGASAKLRDSDGNTSLLHAVKRSAKEAVKALLPASDLAASNNEGNTALTLAAGGHDIELLTLVLEGSEVDHKNKDGDTALIVAARGARPDAVAALCKRADCNAQNAKGRTALVEALRSLTEKKSGWSSGNDMGPLRCVLRLLPLTDLDLQDEAGETALMKCAEAGLPELLGLMLPRADVNARDAKGATALARLSGGREDAECFELVLERADARIVDNEGRTPLMRAIWDEEKMRALVGRSDVDAADDSGQTALMLAAGRHSATAAQILLDAGADAALVDAQGRTAEAIAREHGEAGEELANLLREVAGSQSFRSELQNKIRKPAKPPQVGRKKRPGLTL